MLLVSIVVKLVTLRIKLLLWILSMSKCWLFSKKQTKGCTLRYLGTFPGEATFLSYFSVTSRDFLVKSKLIISLFQTVELSF